MKSRILLALLVLLFPQSALAMVDCDRCEKRSPPPKSRTYVVAAMGASLTDERVGGARYLKGLARRCPESQFDAYGVGGQRTNHMRQRFLRDIFGVGSRDRTPKPTYTHVIIFAGINDLSEGPTRWIALKDMQRNLSFMYAEARSRGVDVVALTLPPWGYAGGWDRRPEATRLLNRWILAERDAGRVAHALDIHPLYSCGDPDTLCDRYRMRPKDAIHWNEEGHEILAELLYREVFPDCR